MPTAAIAAASDRYLAAFAELEPHRAGREPAAFIAARRAASEAFRELGFPTPRLEEWRFTDVAALARTDFDLAAGADGVAPSDLEAASYPEAVELVLVNGRFDPELSRLEGLPDGVVVCSLATAWREHPELVEPWLGRQAAFEKHPFVALNTALHRDGAFIFAPRNVVVERPVNIVHVARSGVRPAASFPRHLVVAGESSQLTVVEQYLTADGGRHFTCPVIEIEAGPNAFVDHYKLEREAVESFHMATIEVHLERSANVSSHSISWGGGLVRNDVNASLVGEGSEATLNGLYMVEGTQLVDHHMRVEHVAPHCASHELFKGILEGRSRAVFNGRIYVHRGAQKTDAKQTNRNLLLSREALVNSNPQLEIFADDVKCTHGSTVGQLDELGIFYLRSRGIGVEAARSLLTYAFAADIVGRIRVDPVRRDLEEFLFRRLPRGEVVRQAV